MVSPSPITRRRPRSAGSTWAMPRKVYLELSDENRDRVRLGLEDGLGHVAEVLAVGLERQWLSAADDEPIEVVAGEHAAGALQPAPHHDACQQPRQRSRRYAFGRNQVETELEARARREAKRPRAGGREDRAVGDECDRSAAEPLDLQPRAVAAQQQHRA